MGLPKSTKGFLDVEFALPHLLFVGERREERWYGCAGDRRKGRVRIRHVRGRRRECTQRLCVGKQLGVGYRSLLCFLDTFYSLLALSYDAFQFFASSFDFHDDLSPPGVQLTDLRHQSVDVMLSPLVCSRLYECISECRLRSQECRYRWWRLALSSTMRVRLRRERLEERRGEVRECVEWHAQRVGHRR